MLKKYIPFIFSILLISLLPASSFSQDPGEVDTAIVECIDVVRPNSQVVLNIYIHNDEELGGYQIPLAFPDPSTHLDITCDSIVFTDVFTPKTIHRFTGHVNGAVYGTPSKTKTGMTHLENLFICGTDQGFLGIIGAMLSGISMANLHVLQKA